MSSDKKKQENLERLAAERAAIVARYDHGRDQGAFVDPWEDPAFEVYHVTDRYGFIHDSRLPEKLTAHETKVREIENERLNKWLKMMKNWEKYRMGEKLKRRIYKGIPNAVRGEVWLRLLEVHEIKDKQKHKYQDMREHARKWSPDIRQIDLDVNRTYRNHIMFRERYNVKQQALFHVLAAYSMYNSEIGYCQGMSQIAALLLMYMNEEIAKKCIMLCHPGESFVISWITKHRFFIPGFPKLKRFQEHHDRILQKLLPKLKKHLDRYEIHTSLYTLKWFFQCFLDRVPFTLTLRLWDIYLLEGELVLTAMSYTLLKLHRKTMMKMGMEELVDFLQVRLEHDFGYHDDAAIDSLQTSIDELHKQKMQLPEKAPESEFPKRPFGIISEIPPEFIHVPKKPVESVPNGKHSPAYDEQEMDKKDRHLSPINDIVEKNFENTEEIVTTDSHLPSVKLELDECHPSNYNLEVVECHLPTYNAEIVECHFISNEIKSIEHQSSSCRESKLSDIGENDNGSSIIDPLSSRNSLAETSQTSAADLSALSGFSSPSTTLSRKWKHQEGSPVSTTNRAAQLRRTHSLYDSVDNKKQEKDTQLPPSPCSGPPSPDSVRIFVPFDPHITDSSPQSFTHPAIRSPSIVSNNDITPTNNGPSSDDLTLVHVHLGSRERTQTGSFSQST